MHPLVRSPPSALSGHPARFASPPSTPSTPRYARWDGASRIYSTRGVRGFDDRYALPKPRNFDARTRHHPSYTRTESQDGPHQVNVKPSHLGLEEPIGRARIRTLPYHFVLNQPTFDQWLITVWIGLSLDVAALARTEAGDQRQYGAINATPAPLIARSTSWKRGAQTQSPKRGRRKQRRCAL